MKQRLLVNTQNKKSHINRELYGHLLEHVGSVVYEGVWVGKDSPIPNTNGFRNDVVEALKQIRCPVMRWPGGDFVSYYHWKDGIGPQEERRPMVNQHWGEMTDDMSFGLHEFLDLCELLECEPFIMANNASSTVKEIADLIEYVTYPGDSAMTRLRRKNGREKPWNLKFFGVGNEWWSWGGFMTGESYALEYNKRMTYCPSYGKEPLYRITRGPQIDDFAKMEAVVDHVADKLFDAVTLYMIVNPVPSNKWVGWPKGGTLEFTSDEYYDTIASALRADKAIDRHAGILYKDPAHDEKKIVIDEWGVWYTAEPDHPVRSLYQQNTMRDAMVAAVTLNIFNKHSDVLYMANLSMTVNALQAAILTKGEKMLKTPVWHVFDMYKDHQDATLVDSFLESRKIENRDYEMVSHSASITKDGKLLITLANSSLESDAEITCDLPYFTAKNVHARILGGNCDIHSYNSFEEPESVVNREFDGVALKDGGFEVVLPPASIVAITLD